jgi:predicted TIM-barrel fold metal-dependent hydrolase
MVLNKLHGSTAFAVRKEHCDDLEAGRELLDRKMFVMDVQQHHVDLNLYPDALGCSLRFVDKMAAGGCPASLGQANFVKEVFVDSETDVGVISGLPFGGVPLGPAAMLQTRDLVNALAGSERCLAQAVCDPAPQYQNGATAISTLAAQRARGTRAVKCYTYSGNWRLDDETVAYPMLQEVERVGFRLVNVHKGLPALFAPGSQETVRATDFPKAVHDWPELSFCAYHSAYFTSADDHPEGKVGLTEWLEVLASIPKKERKRVYSEIGSSFAIVLIQGPDAAAHFMGQLLKALGPRNILWGTDSIWWGSPQWLIDAFKALTIPEQMQEQFGYPPLTERTKRLILGLNSARLYGVKPKAERCTLTSNRLAEFQGEQGGSRAGRALVAHGPTTRREFFALLRAEKRAQLG